MTLHTPIWVQNETFSAREDRTVVELTPGVGPLSLDELKVTQRAGGANMSVDVSPGVVVIPASVASRGKYLCRSDAVENVAISAAPATGNSRWDLIVAAAYDTEYGDPTDSWGIEAVTGAPASIPVRPSVPAGSVVLAEVKVNAEVAAITNGNIGERRSFARGVVYAAAGQYDIEGHNGQILVTAEGTLSAYADGEWFDQPHAGLFAHRSTTLSFAHSTGGTHSGQLIGPVMAANVTVEARLTGYSLSLDGGTAAARVEISLDGGTTWIQGPRAWGGYADSRVSLCPSWSVSGYASGSVRARAHVQRYGGTSSNFEGGLELTMRPAGV